ncbi:MAG: DNA-binding protein [Lachnospiraceae bacterium]|nr:DNA-binding protein [Lachnospiraceae bacterium]
MNLELNRACYTTEDGVTIAIPSCEKYMLTIREASIYFSIGTKKLRRLAEDNLGVFSVYCGNKFLINRTKFEQYLNDTSTI